MIDTNLILAIKSGYDAWQPPISEAVGGLSRSTDNHLIKYDDPKLDKIKTIGGWKRIVGWDLGKMRDPSAIVIIKYRLIETARNRYYYRDPETFQERSYCKESCVTPVYQLIAARNYHEDYTATVQRLRTFQENQRLDNCSLVFDATGVGVAIEEQLRHLPGFQEVIGMTITGGDGISRKNMFTSCGKTRLLSDLQQVVEQKRIAIPDPAKLNREEKADLEQLTRQITGLQVEETLQGYYKTIDDRKDGHHHDLMIALAMAVAWVEYQAGRYQPIIWV